MAKRELSLDYIKGILILLVVYGHCLFWLDGNNNSYDYYFIPRIIYTFHMPLFVFLSGYFFSRKKNENIFTTITEKFRRLIIPHLFFNIIMIIPIICFWETYSHFVTRFSNDIISFKSIYHYITMFWFLWCVYFSSIISNIIYIITNNSKTSTIILIIIAFIFMLISQSQRIHIFIEHQHMGTMFLYFILGIFTNNNIKTLTLNPLKYGSYILFFIYLLFIYFIPQIGDNIIYSEIGGIIGIICMCNIFMFFYNHNWGTTLLLYFSKWTLGIYIYHFVILYAIINVTNTIYSHCNNMIIITSNFIIAIIVTLVTGRITELLSMSSFLRKYAFGAK